MKIYYLQPLRYIYQYTNTIRNKTKFECYTEHSYAFVMMLSQLRILKTWFSIWEDIDASCEFECDIFYNFVETSVWILRFVWIKWKSCRYFNGFSFFLRFCSVFRNISFLALIRSKYPHFARLSEIQKIHVLKPQIFYGRSWVRNLS